MPTISTAFLLPQDRLPHLPLESWAAKLLSNLARTRRAVRSPRGYAAAVAPIANNAALIASQEGLPEEAAALCEAQLRWQRRFARRASDRAIVAHGIQPWVNLGRLDALARRSQAALDRFELLAQYAAQGALTLGHTRIADDDWQVVTDSQVGFVRLLENMRVIDSLRALLLDARYDDVIAFGETVRAARRDGLGSFGDEATIIAASLQENHELAITTARAARDGVNGWLRVVLQIRLAEAVARAGDLVAAGRVIGPVTRTLSGLSAEARGQLEALHVTQRAAIVCAELDLEDAAVAMARQAYAGAVNASDEVIQIDSLGVLALFHTGSERRRYEETLTSLRERTCYARYRLGKRRRGGPAFELREGLHAVFRS